MASLTYLPPEILEIVLDPLIDYTLYKEHLTRESSRILQNLRLSHRSFANNHTINGLLFDRILLRVSKVSYERLKSTHARVGLYVQKLIIEASQFMSIRDFDEYRTLLKAHSEIPKHATHDLPFPDTWLDIEVTHEQLLDGFTAYEQRARDDLLAARLLGSNAREIFTSFKALHHVEVVKSWDEGGPDAEQIFTLLPLGFKGFITHESIKSTRREMQGRVGLVYDGLLDKVIWRHCCHNLIRTTWTVLWYILPFLGEAEVLLGDSFIFMLGEGAEETQEILEDAVQQDFTSLIAGISRMPAYGRAGDDNEDRLILKRAVEDSLIHSAMAFTASFSHRVSITSLSIQGPGSHEGFPSPLQESALFKSIHNLRELTIEGKLVRTDSLFRNLEHYMPFLERLSFLDCILLHGITNIRSRTAVDRARRQFHEEAMKLTNKAGRVEVVISHTGEDGSIMVYSAMHMHEPMVRDVWAKHLTVLRAYLLDRFQNPDAHRDEVDAPDGISDGNALVIIF